jgi:membrane protein DedA with SNARE-associated domain
MNTFVQVLVKHGYSALFASVFACQMALPVPAILFLMAAGVLAGSGQLSLCVVLGLAVIACLLADLLWYEAGRRWGNQILHFIYGLAADPHAAVRRAKRNFHRHGYRTLILAKFVVGLDAAAPPLAGLSGTGRFRFLAFDAIGAALWASAYAGLGYVFSKDLDRAASYVASLGKVFAVLLLAGMTIYFGRKLVRRIRSVREFRRSRIAPERPGGRLKTGERIMTLDFQNQKKAHGVEHAPGQSHQDACGQYTTRGDFCRIFYEQTRSLYRLSFLLTADQEKAQQCFVSGLEDSVKGSPVFKEWARSWARRTIIQNAVRVIHPQPIEEHARTSFGSNDTMLAAEPPELAAVLLLDPFERFVYVMSVLEHYSDQDCSLLLGCAQRDVVAGRVRALQQTGSAVEFNLALAER